MQPHEIQSICDLLSSGARENIALAKTLLECLGEGQIESEFIKQNASPYYELKIVRERGALGTKTLYEPAYTRFDDLDVSQRHTGLYGICSDLDFTKSKLTPKTRLYLYMYPNAGQRISVLGLDKAKISELTISFHNILGAGNNLEKSAKTPEFPYLGEKPIDSIVELFIGRAYSKDCATLPPMPNLKKITCTFANHFDFAILAKYPMLEDVNLPTTRFFENIEALLDLPNIDQISLNKAVDKSGVRQINNFTTKYHTVHPNNKRFRITA